MQDPEQIYGDILQSYIKDCNEGELLRAQDFGRALVKNEVPPEEVAALHDAALRKFEDSIDHMNTMMFIERSSAVLLEVLMAYGLANREQLERANSQRAALKESEERFKDFANAASDWFWEMGPDLRFTYFSERIVDITDDVQGAFIGKTIKELVPPQTGNEAWQAHLNALKNHLPFRDVEYELIKPDGTCVWVRSSGLPVFSKDGTFRGYRGLGANITAHRQIENELYKMSQAVRQSPNLEFITDTDGNIEYANGKFYEVTGYTAQEVIGQNPRIIQSGNTPPSLYEDLWKTITSETVWQGEIEDRCKDGRHFFANVTITPLRTENGTITHYFASHHDITLRKEAENRMREARDAALVANRTKADLLANMSHELRTPLNAIIGFSDMMRGEFFGPIDNDKYRQYIDDIHYSGEHLLGIVNDILDVSAIELGKVTLSEEPVSVTKIIDACVRLIAPRADVASVSVTTAIDFETLEIYADTRRIKQVLLNLLSNSIKFTPKGGEVRIASSLNQAGAVFISVTDNGIGMDEKEVTTALSRFGQVDGGLDRKVQEGTGLGLPLSKALMELHSGTLEITSKKGQGTSVTVIFPQERCQNHPPSGSSPGS